MTPKKPPTQGGFFLQSMIIQRFLRQVLAHLRILHEYARQFAQAVVDVVVGDGVGVVKMAAVGVDVVGRHQAAEVIENRLELVFDDQVMLVSAAVRHNRYRLVAHGARMQHVECILQDTWNRTLENRRGNDIAVGFFKAADNFLHAVIVFTKWTAIDKLMVVIGQLQHR